MLDVDGTGSSPRSEYEIEPSIIRPTSSIIPLLPDSGGAGSQGTPSPVEPSLPQTPVNGAGYPGRAAAAPRPFRFARGERDDAGLRSVRRRQAGDHPGLGRRGRAAGLQLVLGQ